LPNNVRSQGRIAKNEVLFGVGKSLNQPSVARNPRSRLISNSIGVMNRRTWVEAPPSKGGFHSPCGRNHPRGPSSLSISILFNPKSHASIDRAPGPTNAKPAPIEARRITGQTVSWKTRISLADNATERMPATGVQTPAISAAPFATSSKPSSNGQDGTPALTLTLPSRMRAAPAAIRMSRSPRADRPPTKLEINRRTERTLGDPTCALTYLDSPFRGETVTLSSIRDR